MFQTFFRPLSDPFRPLWKCDKTHFQTPKPSESLKAKKCVSEKVFRDKKW